MVMAGWDRRRRAGERAGVRGKGMRGKGMRGKRR